MQLKCVEMDESILLSWAREEEDQIKHIMQNAQSCLCVYLGE